MNSMTYQRLYFENFQVMSFFENEGVISKDVPAGHNELWLLGPVNSLSMTYQRLYFEKVQVMSFFENEGDQ